MTTDDKRYYLSRRRVLGGLGAIGLASAGAGLGTSAYLTDTESFTGNTLTAGTLDMSVTATQVAADGYWAAQSGVLGRTSTADGAPVIGLQAQDVKPGDWLVVELEVAVLDNPGYVQVRTENFTEAGGPNPEPEQVAEGGTGNSADLDDFLFVSGWQSYGGPTDGSTGGQKSDLADLDPVFNNASAAVELSGGYQPPTDLDGNATASVEYLTAREVDTGLAGGYVIKDASGDPMPVGGTSGSPYVIYLLFEVPAAVGNEIQGDSFGFDLVFETEQVRHNDDPFNATAPSP
ncbi:MAG: SipW-dependent-type signal peptide-containing protein [Haloarculaceae archaeon]